MLTRWLRLQSLKSRVTFVTMVVAMISVWSLTFVVVQPLHANMEQALGEPQLSTASAVADQVNSAMADRDGALHGYVKRRITPQVMRDPSALQQLLENGPAIQGLFNGGLVVTDASGTAIAAVPVSAGQVGRNFLDKKAVAAGLVDARPVISRPVAGEAPRPAQVIMFAPILGENGTPIGALGGVTDLGQPNFLGRLTQGRYGKTGTYLLVSKRDRLIVAASDTRRNMEELPPPGVIPTVDRFIQGYEGTGVFVNPRGVEVLASAKGVPVADWYVVAALPTEEAFAPVREVRNIMLLLAIVVTLLASGLAWWMLRRELEPAEAAAKALTLLSDTPEAMRPLPVKRQDEIGQLVGGFNRLLAELGQRRERLELLNRRAEVLLQLPIAAESRDEESFLQYALDALEQLTGSQVSFVHRASEDQQAIELITWSRATLERYCTAVVDKHYPISEAGLWADALRTRMPVVVNDYPNAQGKSGLPDGHARLDRFISIPVVEEGLVLMIIGAGNKPRDYDETDLETARLVVETLWRITSRRRADAALRASEKSLKEAQRIASVGSYALDLSTERWQSSEEMDRIFGIDASYEHSIQGWTALLHPDDLAGSVEHLRGFVLGQHNAFDKEYRVIRHSDKALRWIHGLGKLEFDAQGVALKLIGTIQDITERKLREEALQLAQERLALAQRASASGVWDWNVATGSIVWSDEHFRLFGLDPASSTASFESWRSVLHPDDVQAAQDLIAEALRDHKPLVSEYRIVRPSGEVRWISSHGEAVYDGDGQPLRMTGICIDITDSKRKDERVHELAYLDTLTALPNRRLLIDRLEQALVARRGARRTGGALLFIDLDEFKVLNETLGHEQGDRLLQEAAKRLGGCIRESDTLARLGGDEFVVLLDHLSLNLQEAAPVAESVARKILFALSQPYHFGASALHCTASIGITLFDGSQHEGAVEPLKRAELAMYQAKAAGRNDLRFFDPQMQATVSARAALEAGLREAIRNKQFVLHYQPQLDGQGRVFAAEALLRWQDPRRGMVSPAEFIPMAEATGLIIPLGNWVLEEACRQIALWAGSPAMAHLNVAVNVSARQFHHAGFVEQVLDVLDRTGADANRLKLELTESVLLANVEEVIAKMTALKGKGVGFSMDDFGTGYSSLSYLKRLPLDQLKIDQGFVRNILVDANDAAIAKMVVALANSLGLLAIAEGVETEAQRDFLAELGCHSYQGYLFSRPVPVEELVQQLESKLQPQPDRRSRQATS